MSHVNKKAGVMLPLASLPSPHGVGDMGANAYRFVELLAGAGAAYWQMRYGWEIGIPMYAAAALVGYSRIDAKKHYWWDVAAGAGIGIGFNYLFTSRYVRATAIPTPGGAYLNFGAQF